VPRVEEILIGREIIQRYDPENPCKWSDHASFSDLTKLDSFKYWTSAGIYHIEFLIGGPHMRCGPAIKNIKARWKEHAPEARWISIIDNLISYSDRLTVRNQTRDSPTLSSSLGPKPLFFRFAWRLRGMILDDHPEIHLKNRALFFPGAIFLVSSKINHLCCYGRIHRHFLRIHNLYLCGYTTDA
jgi:hypothetical protein